MYMKPFQALLEAGLATATGSIAWNKCLLRGPIEQEIIKNESISFSTVRFTTTSQKAKVLNIN